MSIRERILIIRLLDKINANPPAAKKLGTIWESSPGELEDQANPGEKSTKN